MRNTIIHLLVMAGGFTPESVVRAVTADDLTLLRRAHSDEK